MDRLMKEIKAFVRERDWAQFHSPKNLSMALVSEAAEILKMFRWLNEQDSYSLSEEQRRLLADEIGDVLICLTNLSEKFDIDPIEAAYSKLQRTGTGFPGDHVFGRDDLLDENSDDPHNNPDINDKS